MIPANIIDNPRTDMITVHKVNIREGMLMKAAAGTISVIIIIALAIGPSCTSDEPGPAPTLVEAGEAEYYDIYDSCIRLMEGSYKGKPFAEGSASRPTVVLVRDIFAVGDLDGDGSDEKVVLIVEDSGGTGSFLYVAVLSRRGGKIRNRDTALAGDRIQVRDLRIAGGEIVINVVQHGPEDAMCCPTQKARRIWKLEKNDLVEGPAEVTGTLSLADLAGGEWTLRQFGADKPYSGDPPVSLVFEDGRISGFSGCNRYFGEVREQAPGTIEIPGLGMTRMTCPDEVNDIENRYLAALEGAIGYRFIYGRLALNCKTENGSTTLVFEAVADAVAGD